MLKRVAIYSKVLNERTKDGVSRLISSFCKRGITMQIFQRSEEQFLCPEGKYIEKFTELTSLSQLPDLVLSVGGDGTFLETVLKVKDSGIPIAGVNTGRMGFLANIPADDIERSIDMLINTEYDIVERCLLKMEKPQNIFSGNGSSALNEITIQKADLSMITINVHVDNIPLNTYWADGLIISTATGSTAYNLSAGGPILSPEDTSIILAPISPHNLTIRPIIISGDSRLKMVIEGRSREYLATCDFRSAHVPFSEEVIIAMDKIKIKTIMLKGMDFYSTLRSKLMWGLDRRN